MSLERTVASARLSEENMTFLREVEANFKPYRVTEGSLMDLCVSIVRHLYRLGDLSLEPAALQRLLGGESLLRKQKPECLQRRAGAK